MSIIAVTDTYSKTLSKSDALEPTKGSKVPYLIISGHGTENEGDKFYNTLFKSGKWYHGFFGRSIVEKLDVTVYYYFEGSIIGSGETLITYNIDRLGKNNTPTTWLHWPDNMIEFFKDRSLGGYIVTIKRFENDVYALGIHKAVS